MLIAISQRNDKNEYGSYVDNLENDYVNYFEKFGIKLIIIPNCSKDVASYFEEFPISGIILSGGNDIDPGLYGGKVEEGTVSKERDETEKKMLEIAIKKKLPVLGICRGMQFINVFFKGKLVTKVKGEVEHVAVEHNITILDKELVKVLGNDIKVNSYHKHKVELSSELEAFAQSSDGVIEGIYHPSLPVAGIQWHPERKSPDEEANNKILKAFLNKELFWKK